MPKTFSRWKQYLSAKGKMQLTMFIFVSGLSVVMLVIYIALTNAFGSANKVSPAKQVYRDEETDIFQKDGRPLEDEVRILCFIVTSPLNLERKAVHVQNTWARRCNVHLFMSSKTNKSFPAIGLNVSEGRGHLTAKTMRAFRYVYDHHFDDADWFMKADDDAYVIVENLRYFLSDKDKNEPVFFGHSYGSTNNPRFFSGGAGYVISKEALRRYGIRGNDRKLCKGDGGAEDVEFGHCMRKLGVKPGKSTDSLGRSRFHPIIPSTRFLDATLTMDKDNISNYAISFHYVFPRRMYEIDFYIYHLRPYAQQ